MQQRRTETPHRNQRQTARRPERNRIARALADPLRLDRVRFGIAAHQRPEQAILPRHRDRALPHAALQGDALKRRNRIAIGRQGSDLFDHSSRDAHRPGRSVIEVDAFEASGQALLDRLDENALTFRKQINRFGRGAEQPVSQNDHFVRDADQTQQGPSPRYHIELRPARLGNMLQLHNIGRQNRSNADDPLTAKR